MPKGVFHRTLRPLWDRLIAKVKVDPDTQCWNWTAATRDGYGVIWVDGKNQPAHRTSYELQRGPIADGMLVCHRCDNRACINPDHLFLGTNADNLADMVSKGRQVRGSVHSNAKLTESDVLAIRSARGVTLRQLSETFGVTETQISNIRTGKQWVHLEGRL